MYYLIENRFSDKPKIIFEITEMEPLKINSEKILIHYVLLSCTYSGQGCLIAFNTEDWGYFKKYSGTFFVPSEIVTDNMFTEYLIMI